jgi:biopolymer transport protein ExbB/TolQ
VIWLLTNVWWLVPLVVGGLALANLPMTLAVIRRVPVRVWLAVAAVALLGLTFQAGRWYERREHQAAQEAAEKRADAKAGRVAKQAQERTRKAVERIHERTEEAADEIDRQMEPVCPDVPLPSVVRDDLADAVRRAREALPAD